jgi:tRNA threonylcarbamoyladenosine biosynthesis protein TsaE
LKNIVHTRTPAETEALGEAWGSEAQAGWVFGLIGDLGAGKTQLVKGLAKGLAMRARILSPTFTLVHEYGDGRLPLYHLDLYRLENEAAIRSAGLDQYLYQKEGVTVVEWADKLPELASIEAAAAVGAHYRLVSIVSIGQTERRIAYDDSRA